MITQHEIRACDRCKETRPDNQEAYDKGWEDFFLHKGGELAKVDLCRPCLAAFWLWLDSPRGPTGIVP